MKRWLLPAMLMCGTVQAQPEVPAAEVAPVREIPAAIAPDIGAIWAGIPGPRFAPEVEPARVELPATRVPPGLPDPMPPIEVMDSIVAGYVEPAPADYFANLAWHRMPDGSLVGAVVLRSVSAKSLRVQIEGSLAQRGMQLRVFDPVEGHTFGPYDNAPMDAQQRWWSTIIFGDSIGLELRLLPGADMPAVPPRVTAINYQYANPPGYRERGCSLVDALCSSTGSTERTAITLLCTVNGSGNLSSFCTGSRWSRTPADFSPLIHTANHCIGTNSAANNTVLVWDYRSSTCNGSTPNPNTLPRSTGCVLLKTNTDNDYNMMGSLEPVTSGVYLGWSTADPGNGTSIHGLSHPSGLALKISIGESNGQSHRTFCDSNGNNCFDADVWDVQWTTGETLPGSSGSPLIDSSSRARGVLSGGPSDCTVSRYGRFDTDSYNSASPYIDGPADPNYVWRTPPLPLIQNGSSTYPFDTVVESMFAVPEDGTVSIFPGTYPENLTIWRPMTLTRWGSSGTVTIGD